MQAVISPLGCAGRSRAVRAPQRCAGNARLDL